MATSQCQPVLSLEKLVNPTDRQREFLRAVAEKDYVLYGGAAGGGKSYILRWWLVLYLVWVFRVVGLRNVTVGMFCEDYRVLNDRQISKIRFEFPEWLGVLKDRDFILRSEYGGGILALRNLDDPSKYHSAEFAAIAVDELTKNPKSIFDDLRFRLRWPGIDHPKFAAGANPGGVGHAWVKKLWVTREYPEELQSVKDQFVLVKAKASDNPHLPPSYYQKLLTLPPDMARKVAEGNWDVYTGQYFPQFSRKHVVTANDAKGIIQPWFTRWLSGDWGFYHPHCIHWHAKDENNRVITYREQWGREVGEAELGQLISTLSAGEKLAAFPFSWDAFGKLSSRTPKNIKRSITDMIGASLAPGIPKPVPADSSPGSRVSGARLMSQLLNSGNWLISDACPRLIECLPTLIRNEENEEDVLKVDYSDNEIGDDPYDSARMGLQHMLGSAVKPKSVILEESFEQVRKKFVNNAMAEPKQFGVDPFAKFGGKKSERRKQ